MYRVISNRAPTADDGWLIIHNSNPLAKGTLTRTSELRHTHYLLALGE
jgi:hypothetical protein